MTKIRVEEKKRNKSPLGWIIGLILLAGIGWLIYEIANDDTETDRMAAGTVTEERVDEDRTTVGESPMTENRESTTERREATSEDANNRFSSWVNEGGMNMGLDHEATSKGIMALSDALKQTAKNNNVLEDISIKSELNKMELMANNIQKDHTSAKHADKIQKAFIQSVEVMDKIQEKKSKNLSEEVADLRKKAKKIKPSELTLNQKEDVKSFFSSADQVLNKMNKNNR